MDADGNRLGLYVEILRGTRLENVDPFSQTPSDTPWTLVRKRTIPTEQPPLVGEVSAKFCGRECRVVSETDPPGR
jgi:hypothetical protein